MTIYDEVSNTVVALRQQELLKLRRAPDLGMGANDLFVAYASNAEFSCMLQLGWELPHNVLDICVEVIAAINGDNTLWESKGRPGLLDALGLYDLPGISFEEKKHWRDVILQNEIYSEDMWEGILSYNRLDTDATVALLGVMWPSIDLPRALMRGRYMKAVARMERVGLPIDTEYLAVLLEHWDDLKRHFIRRDDVFGLYDDISFREERLWSLVEARGWDWPRTPTGRYELKRPTLGRQTRRYPELKLLSRLRDRIAELRINQFANTIGADGYSRCPLLPFWTKTGRNQPSAKDKMFLPGLPAWTHGVIKPPEGWAIFELDYKAEEIALVAAESGDRAMIADYMKDPHLEFAKRSKLVPPDATKQSHGEQRDLLKPVSLGQNYGMTPYGIARKTNKSLLWARDIDARHRLAYSTFHAWRADIVAQAQINGLIETPFSWPMAVTAATSRRTVMNFPAQAAGGDLLQLMTIMATEAGYVIAAPVHDAIWAMAPLDRLEETILGLTEITMQASLAFTRTFPIGVETGVVVRAPFCLGDVRPQGSKPDMWHEVRQLVTELQQRKSA